MDKSLQLINEVVETCSKIGPEKTLQALADARNNPQIFKETVEKYIISTTCKSFRISREKVMTERTWGVRVNATMVIYCMLKKHLSYSLDDLHVLFGKDPSVISKAVTALNSMKPDTKDHTLILEKRDKIDEMITEFIVNEKSKANVAG
jgi:chromosomal replication initiation ATPase DnaA